MTAARKYFVGISIFTILLIAFLYKEFHTVTSSGIGPVFVEITPGKGLEKITRDLKEKKLIRHEMLFRLYARLTGLADEVKAGRYRLENFTPAQILRFLAKPGNGEISVTIPEGSSMFDIDEKLFKLGLIEKDEFLKLRREHFEEMDFLPSQTNSIEGYLFPDTYFAFVKNFEPKDLAIKMLKNFQKRVIKKLSEDIKKSKRSFHEIITVASLLEREIKEGKDRALVAGILWKRYDHSWPLQVDATLLYGKKDRTISANELKRDSPYNTYTSKGLPPTPIGNPGIETIQAAFHPEVSPYWFYLTAKDGIVMYSKTNDEHNAKRAKYLR